MDWTDMGGLGIMIEGKVLAHKLFHAVLPYSNWEWAASDNRTRLSSDNRTRLLLEIFLAIFLRPGSPCA